MESEIQQATNDLAPPTLVAGIGYANNPQYFDFFELTFTHQVATVAAIVGTVWGVINIGKFCYHSFLTVQTKLNK